MEDIGGRALDAEGSEATSLWEPYEREAREISEQLVPLGIPGVADVHVHFMPENVMDKVWRYFDNQGPLIGRPWPITYRESNSKRVEILRRLGVRHYSGLAYPHRPEMAEWLNRWTLAFGWDIEACAPSATFFPEPTAGIYVREAISGGAKIFKAHLQVGSYDPRDPYLVPVWGEISDAQIPVVIHCGSSPVAGSFTGVTPIAEVLRTFPDLKLIIAHMGNDEYEGFLGLAERFEGVMLDTTMAFTPFTEEKSPYPKSLYGRLEKLEDKVLFGSDFPNIPYRYVEAVRAVVELPLSAQWKSKVLWDNPQRVLAPQGERS